MAQDGIWECFRSGGIGQRVIVVRQDSNLDKM